MCAWKGRRLALLLLGVTLTKPIWAAMNVLGPDWNYKVNDMNLLDRLRASPSISPQCASALAGVRVNGSRAARADLLSGRVVESIHLLIALFIGHLHANTTKRELLPIIVDLASPFSSLGKPEVCRDYYVPGFHYCRLDILRWSFRVGACLPIGCTGQDVFDTLLPKNIALLKGEQYSICGTNHYPPDTGTYVMAALLLALAILVLIGTVDDLVGTGNGLRHQSRARAICNAFSLKKNVDILLRPTKEEPLAVLDGIRGLSMLWIILGHLCGLIMWVVLPAAEWMSMTPDHKGFGQRWASQAIWSFHAVNSFLFVTGFLTMLYLLPHLRKARSQRPDTWLKRFASQETPAIILHRLMRISPPYYVALGVYMCIAKTFITATPYTYLAHDLEACQRYWWQNLLYIQNLGSRHMRNPCYLPSWYMAVDLQLLLLAPPLGILAAYNRYACLALCAVITAACTAYAVLVAFRQECAVDPLDIDNFERFLDTIYVKPFYRVPAYLVGIMSGLVWAEWDKKMHKVATQVQRKAASAGAFMFATACTLIGLVVYGYAAFMQSVITSAPQMQVALYIGVSGVAFSLGLALLLFIVLLKLDGGILHALLTWRPLILISRISFCMYLVHFGIILVVLSAEPSSYPFAQSRFIFDYVGFVAASVLVGLVLHLLVERPLCNLERVLGTPRSHKDEGMPPKASDSDSVGSESDSKTIPIEVHRHTELRPTVLVQ